MNTGTLVEIGGAGAAESAAHIASWLVAESVWFEVLPLSDAAWRVTVKREELGRLTRRMADVVAAAPKGDFTAPSGTRLIFSVLELSTAHMTREDNERLAAAVRSGELPAYALGEYGYLVYASDFDENWDEMSPEFQRVMALAEELDCPYVRFDRDGRVYTDLSTFDW